MRSDNPSLVGVMELQATLDHMSHWTPGTTTQNTKKTRQRLRAWWQHFRPKQTGALIGSLRKKTIQGAHRLQLEQPETDREAD